jgi:YVTN family beta-propeller protein
VPSDRRFFAALDSGDSLDHGTDVATEENSLDAKTFGANRLKFTPDGKRVLITSLGDGDLVIYDTASRKEFKRVKIGHGAAGILMDRDGNRAFIACGPDNYVAVEPPLRMLDAGARERHLPLREARLRRNPDRPRLPKLRQPELISRSLLRQHSRKERQITLNNPWVTNLIREFPNNCSVAVEA